MENNSNNSKINKNQNEKKNNLNDIILTCIIYTLIQIMEKFNIIRFTYII